MTQVHPQRNLFLVLVLVCSLKRKATNQNRKSLPNLARAAERFKLSDRTASSVANAVLEDLGLITTSNNKLINDKSKSGKRKTHKVSNNF